MEPIDFRAFVFAVGLVKFITGILTLRARTQAPDIQGSAHWAIGSFLGAISLILLSLHPVTTVTVSLSITNTFLLLGEVGYLTGVRRLKGKPSRFGVLLIIPLCSLVTVILTTAVWPNSNVRLFLNSFYFGLLLFLSGWEWSRMPLTPIRSLGRILGFAFLLMSLMMVLRMWWATSVSNVDHKANVMPNTLIALVGILCQSVIMFGFILAITTLLADSLRKQLAMRDRLFSHIAHDLRNPIGSMMGMAEMLRDTTESTSEEHRTITELLHRSSVQTYELLSELLEWGMSQKSSGLGPTQPTPLADLVARELYLFEPQTARKNIAIQFTRMSNPVLEIDRTMIASVIHNLVSNAVKFTSPGGRIDIEVRTTDDEAQIEVRDTGVGMSHSVQEDLFHSENPVSTQGTDGEKGTGLGLLLCRDFVHRHRGHLDYSSAEGKGSRFTVRLPLPS